MDYAEGQSVTRVKPPVLLGTVGGIGLIAELPGCFSCCACASHGRNEHFWAIHLGLVLALFLTMPHSKFVHGLYRIAA